MRLLLVAGLITGALLYPAAAQAKPATEQGECVCQVFAKYVSWTAYNKWVDSKKGLKGNHQIGDGVKVRVKSFNHDGRKATDDKLCKDQPNEFIDKLCKAYKACLIAAAGVLYGEWVQGGGDFWTSEKHALIACETAIVVTFFA